VTADEQKKFDELAQRVTDLEQTLAAFLSAAPSGIAAGHAAGQARFATRLRLLEQNRRTS
jgi:hypothetical protein